MFNKKTIRDVDLRGKVVLLRADYNVPIEYSEGGEENILNDFRIRSSLPTINYLLENGVRKIIIISHLGRPNSVETLSDLSELEKLPNGKRKFSLRPVFNRLRKILAEDSRCDLNEFKTDFPMNFHTTPIFARTRYSVSMKDADDNYKIEMLENLRFSKDEKANSLEFAEALSQVTGADLFVQDGFGVVHRSHTSTNAIVKKIPSVAGFLLEKEVSTILKALKNPREPFVSIMGGAKISDKLPLIEKFINLSNKMIIGGAIANTFLHWADFKIGKSKIEFGQDEVIEGIIERAHQKFGKNFGADFILPTDVGVGTEFSSNSNRINKNLNEINKNDYILDLGDYSISRLTRAVESAKTIIWNGTVGVSELENFAKASEAVAVAISRATKNGAISIVGGGDTSSFVLNWIEKNPEVAEFSLISTGGGAALELMSGNSLPGLEILPDR